MITGRFVRIAIINASVSVAVKIMAIVLINKTNSYKVFCRGLWVNDVINPKVVYSLDPIHHQSSLGAYEFKRVFWESGFKWYAFVIISPWAAIFYNLRPHYPLNVPYHIRTGTDRQSLGSCLGLR